MQAAPLRPALVDTLTELPRAGLEAAQLLWPASLRARELPRGDGHPVLVLPAYGLGDLGLWPLRRFLDGLGYAAHAAELGVNLDRGELRIRRIEDAARFRRVQSERVAERARAIHAQSGRRASLVGWSMGGLFAFDAARLAPDAVRSVVTLGSPFGDPRGTSLWDVMRRINGSEVPAEEQDFSAWLAPIPCHASGRRPTVTILYSRRDGIVGEGAARFAAQGDSGADPRGEAEGSALDGVRYEHVESSHLGFPVNAAVYRALARALGATGKD